MGSQARGNLLIIEDNTQSAELLRDVFADEGFRTITRGTAEDGLAAARSERPVATLLDWVLPDSPGVEVCRQLRQVDQVMPVIFVSGRTDESSIVRALEAGADDFVVKPFQRGELVARVEAHLRKVRSLAAPGPREGVAPERHVFRAGDVEVDLDARAVEVAGKEVSLGALEFQLLGYFCRNPGIAVSRDQILENVYGYDSELATERVDLLVRRLRGKLGEGPRRGGQIVAVPGYGFRLDRRAGGDRP